MSTEKRPYRMQRRAEAQEETRRRITEAAVELHGTVGPARTSISALAERAGVRRSTVYRHFADEESLFAACSAHWAMRNPPPDLGAWAAVPDPAERLDRALCELYEYYGRVAYMLDNVIRDAEAVPALRAAGAARHAYLAAARDVLMKGRGARGRARARVRAAIGHAVDYATWRSLVREQGLRDDDAVALMRGLVDAAARAAGRPG